LVSVAIVERLEFREFVGMTLDKVAERPDEALPVGRGNAQPRPGLEGTARGGDRQFDIGLIAGRNMREDFLGGRVFDRESLAVAGIDPLAVDQHLMFLDQERRWQGPGQRARSLANMQRIYDLWRAEREMTDELAKIPTQRAA
jgi:hypothetical protein